MKKTKELTKADIDRILEERNWTLIKREPDFGKEIKESRFVRTFCVRCYAAMRVDEGTIERKHWCESCSPRRPTGGNYGPGWKDDTSPAWENMVRCFEDG